MEEPKIDYQSRIEGWEWIEMAGDVWAWVASVPGDDERPALDAYVMRIVDIEEGEFWDWQLLEEDGSEYDLGDCEAPEIAFNKIEARLGLAEKWLVLAQFDEEEVREMLAAVRKGRGRGDGKGLTVFVADGALHLVPSMDLDNDPHKSGERGIAAVGMVAANGTPERFLRVPAWFSDESWLPLPLRDVDELLEKCQDGRMSVPLEL